MRRLASVILLVLGGCILMSQVLVAFMDVGVGIGVNLTGLVIMALFAAPFLLIGAWVSPGQRWRELGLTMLIAAGFAVFAMLSIVAIVFDPGMTRYIPEMATIRLSPIIGGTNLAIVAGIGWLLHQRARAPDAAEVFR